MNCEDIVQRNYKQRLQQKIYGFFFENLNLVPFFVLIFFREFTEINDKKIHTLLSQLHSASQVLFNMTLNK